ncbi:TerD family protein [Methylobacter psychrophilus]|uniref:TerD family protein n=1 Tax=Methylobacter psychrophilus TaxID=96941 RepID=UPI0021D4BEC4|nr:TerD family protein [Methylobacter psychrophilus]
MITGWEAPQGDTRACFKRWGHKKPFLGISGWQVAEDWVKVERRTSDASVTNLTFSPEVTTWLEEGSNYILFLEVEGINVFEIPVRWGGIVANNLLLVSKKHTSNHELVDSGLLVVDSFMCDEASDKISQEDEAAWITAKQLDTKTGYKEYLDRFPSGNFLEAAEKAFWQFMPSSVIVCVLSNISETNKVNCSIDTSVFLLSSAGKVRGDLDFVSSFASGGDSGQILSRSPCGSVRHLGKGNGLLNSSPMESVVIDFSNLPSQINSIAITVSIYTKSRIVGLESVISGTVEILQCEPKILIDEIPMQKGLSGIKGIFLVEFIRRGDDWVILKKNKTFADGLNDICKYFGLEVC